MISIHNTRIYDLNTRTIQGVMVSIHNTRSYYLNTQYKELLSQYTIQGVMIENIFYYNLPLNLL